MNIVLFWIVIICYNLLYYCCFVDLHGLFFGYCFTCIQTYYTNKECLCVQKRGFVHEWSWMEYVIISRDELKSEDQKQHWIWSHNFILISTMSRWCKPQHLKWGLGLQLGIKERGNGISDFQLIKHYNC